MDPSYIAQGVSVAWTCVTAVALYVTMRGKAYRQYPALVAYFALCFLFGISFGFLPYGPHSIRVAQRYVWYFWSYWTTYLACGVLLFFTIQSIFRDVMAPLPGLSRIGVLVFRWVVLISVIVAMTSSFTPVALSKHSLVTVSMELMRCVSIMELCLLACVTLVAPRLGLSYRSRPFGMALAFGMMAAVEFVATAFTFHIHGVFSTANIIVQVFDVIAVGVCAYYFWRPEPARSQVVMAPTLLRWNEVAMALGKAGAQTVPTPEPAFFLSDVEKVVDQVLIRNSFKVTNP